MSGFTKVFQSIVTSSVWCEDLATFKVWMGMLAMSDAHGIVEGTLPGFANLCKVTRDQMAAAELILTSPDPDSRTPDNDGRRIERISGGWRILNYRLYRDRAQDKEGSKAPAMRALRAKRKAVTPGNEQQQSVTQGNALPGEVTRYPEVRREIVVVDVVPGSKEPSGNNGPTSEHHSRSLQRAGARAREAPRIPRCTRATAAGECNHELQRERGMYRSEGTGGRGWLCKLNDGGCGAVYPRDAPEVLRQLGDGAKAALEREIGAETAGHKELAAEGAEVARLVEEFVYGEGDGLRAEVQGATEAFGLWEQISKHIAANVQPHAYNTWFRPIAGARLDGKRLVVAVPSANFAEWIPQNYRLVIASAVKQLERDGIQVAFVPESQLLLERFDAWAGRKKLVRPLRDEVLQAVRRQLGEPAA